MAEVKSRQVVVNFEGVESGGGGVHVPEGDYGFKIASVEQKIGADSGKPYLLFMMEIIKGEKRGKRLSHNCTLQKSGLWNLRNLLEATGKSIPSKALKIDLDKLVGLTFGGTVTDDEYEGKKKSVIGSTFPIADLPEVGKSTKSTKDLEKEVEDPGDGETVEAEADEAEELFT